MIVSIKPNDEHQYLEQGREYVVYAMYLGQRNELMLHSERLPSAPLSVALEKLNIIDGRLSRYWVCSGRHVGENGSLIAQAVLAFPEWSRDVIFFGNLVDGKGNAGEIWRSYKKKMDLEFAGSSISVRAVELDEKWVQCAICNSSWAPDSKDEILVCPKCETKQISPSALSKP